MWPSEQVLSSSLALISIGDLHGPYKDQRHTVLLCCHCWRQTICCLLLLSSAVESPTHIWGVWQVNNLHNLREEFSLSSFYFQSSCKCWILSKAAELFFFSVFLFLSTVQSCRTSTHSCGSNRPGDHSPAAIRTEPTSHESTCWFKLLW